MVFLEDAEVLKNVRVADGIYELACRAPQIAGEGRPGQFVHMTVSPHRSTTSSPLLRRPFSFYGVIRKQEQSQSCIGFEARDFFAGRGKARRASQHAGPTWHGIHAPFGRKPCIPGGKLCPSNKKLCLSYTRCSLAAGKGLLQGGKRRLASKKHCIACWRRDGDRAACIPCGQPC